MNNNLTEIAFILDRSGSMAGLHDVAVEGFNQFLTDQQTDECEVRLSLILFDHEYSPHYESVPVAELVPMTMDEFQPRGSTALLDAMGHTIDSLGERLAKMPAERRPGHVIVATMTDGMENASKHFDLSDIHKKITHQQKEYEWEFLFLSSDLKAIDLAGYVGIEKDQTILYEPTKEGNRTAYRTSIDAIREIKERRRRREVS